MNYQLIETKLEPNSFTGIVYDLQAKSPITILVKVNNLSIDEQKNLLLWNYQNIGNDDFENELKFKLRFFMPNGNNIQCFYDKPTQDLNKCIDLVTHAMYVHLQDNPLDVLCIRNVKMETLLGQISSFLLNKSMSTVSDKIMGDEAYNLLLGNAELDKI